MRFHRGRVRFLDVEALACVAAQLAARLTLPTCNGSNGPAAPASSVAGGSSISKFCCSSSSKGLLSCSSMGEDICKGLEDCTVSQYLQQMFHLCRSGLNRPTLRYHLSCILIPGRSVTDPKICELRCFSSDTTSRLPTGSTPTLSLVRRPNPIKWIPAFHDKELTSR